MHSALSHALHLHSRTWESLFFFQSLVTTWTPKHHLFKVWPSYEDSGHNFHLEFSAKRSLFLWNWQEEKEPAVSLCM